MGRIPWNKGKNIQTNTGKTHFKKGRSLPKKQIGLLKELNKGKKNYFFGKHLVPWNKGKKTGFVPSSAFKINDPRITKDNNTNWKGGITPENRKIRTSTEYVKWRQKILKRDNYECIFCKHKGENNWVDHIKPFSLYPELRFDLGNGRTVCMNCALKLPTHGTKVHRFMEG